MIGDSIAGKQITVFDDYLTDKIYNLNSRNEDTFKYVIDYDPGEKPPSGYLDNLLWELVK